MCECGVPVGPLNVDIRGRFKEKENIICREAINVSPLLGEDTSSTFIVI